MVKTSPFHGGNPGSSPGGVTTVAGHKLCDIFYADVVELADTQDLGSCAEGVKVRVLSSAPQRGYDGNIGSFLVFNMCITKKPVDKSKSKEK